MDLCKVTDEQSTETDLPSCQRSDGNLRHSCTRSGAAIAVRIDTVLCVSCFQTWFVTTATLRASNVRYQKATIRSCTGTA